MEFSNYCRGSNLILSFLVETYLSLSFFANCIESIRLPLRIALSSSSIFRMQDFVIVF